VLVGLGSLVSLGYYLPVIMAMTMRAGTQRPRCTRQVLVSKAGKVIIAGAVAAHHLPRHLAPRFRFDLGRRTVESMDQTCCRGGGAAMNVPKTIFRQYDVRGLVDRELTPELATALGRAMASLGWTKLGSGASHRRPGATTGRRGSGSRRGSVARIALAGGTASTLARCLRPHSTSPSTP
jgi:hypothetical protein